MDCRPFDKLPAVTTLWRAPQGERDSLMKGKLMNFKMIALSACIIFNSASARSWLKSQKYLAASVIAGASIIIPSALLYRYKKTGRENEAYKKAHELFCSGRDNLTTAQAEYARFHNLIEGALIAELLKTKDINAYSSRLTKTIVQLTQNRTDLKLGLAIWPTDPRYDAVKRDSAVLISELSAELQKLEILLNQIAYCLPYVDLCQEVSNGNQYTYSEELELYQLAKKLSAQDYYTRLNTIIIRKANKSLYYPYNDYAETIETDLKNILCKMLSFQQSAIGKDRAYTSVLESANNARTFLNSFYTYVISCNQYREDKKRIEVALQQQKLVEIERQRVALDAQRTQTLAKQLEEEKRKNDLKESELRINREAAQKSREISRLCVDGRSKLLQAPMGSHLVPGFVNYTNQLRDSFDKIEKSC